MDIVAVLLFLAISSYLFPRISLKPIDTHIRFVVFFLQDPRDHSRSTMSRYA